MSDTREYLIEHQGKTKSEERASGRVAAIELAQKRVSEWGESNVRIRVAGTDACISLLDLIREEHGSHGLVWEPLVCTNLDIDALGPDKPRYRTARGHTWGYRASVFGGWLVLVGVSTGKVSQSFVPDPKHEWDGTSSGG